MSIRDIAELVLRRDEHRGNTIPGDPQERALLPHEIFLSVRHPRSTRQERLLLTGATGFLGSHLLAEIPKTQSSRISCIVRAPDKKAAWTRIKATLESWGLWQGNFAASFDAYCGDISKPFLGLSSNDYIFLASQTDQIYHSAATVSFIVGI